MTAVLCVLGGIGLMALVIVEGLAGHYRDDDQDQLVTVALPPPIHDKRSPVRSGVTVWELRQREQAESLPYHPALLRRPNRPDHGRAGARGHSVDDWSSRRAW
jgi:hypothetical protein